MSRTFQRCPSLTEYLFQNSRKKMAEAERISAKSLDYCSKTCTYTKCSRRMQTPLWICCQRADSTWQSCKCLTSATRSTLYTADTSASDQLLWSKPDDLKGNQVLSGHLKFLINSRYHFLITRHRQSLGQGVQCRKWPLPRWPSERASQCRIL